VSLGNKMEKDRYELDPKLEDLGDSLKNEVLSVRTEWSTTGGAAKGVSLIYRLMSEERYLAAKRVVDLFLFDNPDHGVALRQREKIDAVIMKETKWDKIRMKSQAIIFRHLPIQTKKSRRHKVGDR
jgi:hypothetical protein